tara:strand:+ start:6021 stop:6830 length:810 start_codon:yes stop_codon:yes gene_type:complete
MKAAAQRFFRALTQTVTSTEDVRDIKTHINQVNARYFGNGLGANKMHSYLCNLLGSEQANKLSDNIMTQAGELTALPLNEQLDALLGELLSPLNSAGRGDTYIHNEDEISRIFYLPLITLNTKDGDAGINELELRLEVKLDTTATRICIRGRFVLWQPDTKDNSEGPDDLLYGWDISEGIDGYFATAGEKGYGRLVSIKASPYAVGTAGFTPRLTTGSNEYPYLVQMSGLYMQKIILALHALADMTPDYHLHDDDEHEVFVIDGSRKLP